jgi:isoaspartyl peptidase/L-asparaginase-like protein (Ntn-hydrolase superfamily)
MSETILSTWSFGPVANAAALAELARGGTALDAAVAAAGAVELDPSVNSVGVGGIPDADGQVSLDACVMTDPARCGSVAFVRKYPNPAAIARRVMEKTIHVMLVGEGAEQFAAREGFEAAPLLTGEAIGEWAKWRSAPATLDRARYRGWLPPVNVEESEMGRAGGPGGSARRGEMSSHDTVSILVRDEAGRLAGVCTTSGMAFKVPGRVGDSPIIGHGLYVDQRAGAAAATGTGELVMGVCGSFLAVELMRGGVSVRQAIEGVLRRIEASYTLEPEHQVALIAMAPDGTWASGALRGGFVHCVSDGAGTRVEPAQAVLRGD